MKIGVNFLSFRSYQGTETFAQHTMARLLLLSKDTGYVIFTTPYLPEEMNSSIAGAQIIYTYLHPEHNLAMGLYQQLILPVILMKNRINIFYSPLPSIPIFFPGTKIITIHDCAYDRFPEFRSRLSKLYLKLMYYTGKYICDVIITVSQFSKNELINLYNIKPEKIRVIYPGVPAMPDIDQEFIKQTKALFNLYTPYFIYIGNTRPRKNLEGLLKAFNILTKNYKDIKLVLAGKIDESFVNIKGLINTLGLTDRIIRTDFVSEKQKVALYKGSSGLVFPSFYEGFGLPVLEAQSLGVPVLTSSTSSLPEISGNGAIFVDPYNIEDIANGMERLLNTSVRKELIELGYENTKRFSWENTAKELLRVFKELQ
ncbi:MAG: glycosyltransferase family 4 protein [bacterium]